MAKITPDNNFRACSDTHKSDSKPLQAQDATKSLPSLPEMATDTPKGWDTRESVSQDVLLPDTVAPS